MQNTSIKDLSMNVDLDEFYLTAKEDVAFMANIDMDELARGVEQAEREIAEGKGIPFEKAMAQIHKEVFGERL